MIAHSNRWLLAFAAAYLALLPTNVATFAHSFAFGGAVVFALTVLALTLGSGHAAIPAPPRSVALALAIWCLWSLASLTWSIDPAYSETQLEREIGDSVVVMFVFYVAARDARAFRALCATALASLAVLAVVAIAELVLTGAWDAGRWHQGVGPWSTWTVLVTPLLFGLIAPPPVGFGNGVRSLLAGFALIALVIVTDRMTDNRIVWIALAGTFVATSVAAALRWPQTFVRTPVRWIAPLVVILVVLGVAFTDAARERATEIDVPGVAQSLERDPRIALWEHIFDKIEARPWLGYGFGRRVLAERLAAELHNPLLAHAHNTFVSQWLQTGFVGMVAFCALLATLLARYVRFVRARDDALAFAGVVGIGLVTAFVLKNVTDDFLFRSNAKEFFALAAMVLGFGMQRERALRERTRGGARVPASGPLPAAMATAPLPAAALTVPLATGPSPSASAAADAAAPAERRPAEAPPRAARPGRRPAARTRESTP